MFITHIEHLNTKIAQNLNFPVSNLFITAYVHHTHRTFKYKNCTKFELSSQKFIRSKEGHEHKEDQHSQEHTQHKHGGGHRLGGQFQIRRQIQPHASSSQQGQQQQQQQQDEQPWLRQPQGCPRGQREDESQQHGILLHQQYTEPAGALRWRQHKSIHQKHLHKYFQPPASQS